MVKTRWVARGNSLAGPPAELCAVRRPQGYENARMPRKVRELIADLKRAGFVDRGGKGDHRNFVHPKVTKPVTVSGVEGDDAKQYQERAVRRAIEESHK